MPVISANGIEIAYDDRGCRDDPTILLIMGLATQMIAWPEPFCDSLAARGFCVVRFDNRDVGLSTRFEAAPPVDLGAILQQVMAGEKINPPYDLTNMAADTVERWRAEGEKDRNKASESRPTVGLNCSRWSVSDRTRYRFRNDP